MASSSLKCSENKKGVSRLPARIRKSSASTCRSGISKCSPQAAKMCSKLNAKSRFRDSRRAIPDSRDGENSETLSSLKLHLFGQALACSRLINPKKQASLGEGQTERETQITIFLSPCKAFGCRFHDHRQPFQEFLLRQF